MNLNKLITIILVSYRSRNKVINFVKKVPKKFKIIIIDNSKDNYLKKKLKFFNKNILVFLKKNNGYGSAINFARTKIKTKYFLVCNPDISINNNNIITNFYKCAVKLKDKFLCIGPNYNSNNIEKKNKIIKVNKISGACMFINSKAFDFIGGFDENIFLYFEEDDLCKRGNKINLYSYKLISQSVNHDIGTSVEARTTKEKMKLKHLTLWHFIWSKYYFYKKNYGTIISFLLFLPVLMRIYFKLILNLAIKDKKNFQKYKYRYDGLITSISGGKSYKRIF